MIGFELNKSQMIGVSKIKSYNKSVNLRSDVAILACLVFKRLQVVRESNQITQCIMGIHDS